MRKRTNYVELAKEIDKINEGGTGASWYPIADQKLRELVRNGDRNASKLLSHLRVVEQGSDSYNRGIEAYIHSMEGHRNYGERPNDVKHALELASKRAGILPPVTAGLTSAKPPVADDTVNDKAIPTDTASIDPVEAKATIADREPVRNNTTSKLKAIFSELVHETRRHRRRH